MSGLSKPIAHQATTMVRPPETWTLTLNRYQRDNLLWLLNRIGYPYNNEWRDPELARLNSGDWVGELVLSLAKVERWEDGRPVTVMVIDENDHPNGKPSTAAPTAVDSVSSNPETRRQT